MVEMLGDMAFDSVEELRNRILDLEAQLRVVGDDNEILLKEKDKLEGDLAEMRAAYEVVQDKAAGFESQVHELEKEVDYLSDKVDKLEDLETVETERDNVWELINDLLDDTQRDAMLHEALVGGNTRIWERLVTAVGESIPNRRVCYDVKP